MGFYVRILITANNFLLNIVDEAIDASIDVLNNQKH